MGALTSSPRSIDQPQTSVHSIVREYTDDSAFIDNPLGDWDEAIEDEYTSAPPIHVPQSQSMAAVDSMSALWSTNQITSLQTPSELMCSWCSTINPLSAILCNLCSISLSGALVLYDEMSSTHKQSDKQSYKQSEKESDRTTCSDEEWMVYSKSFMSQTHKDRVLAIVAAGYVRTACKDVPLDIINILRSFCAPHFGWCPHPLSKQHFVLTNDQDYNTWSMCRRIDDNGQSKIWRNIFWSQEAYFSKLRRRFVWALQLDRHHNGNIMVGFVESNDTQYNCVGSNFAAYNDGSGILVKEKIATVCLQ